MITTPTARERAAANELAKALIELMVAIEDGVAERRKVREPRRPVERVVEAKRGSDWIAPPSTKPVDAPQHLLGVREAAEFLGVGQRLLWTLSAPRGPIPCVKISRVVRYTVKDLEDFVRKQTTKQRPA